LTQNLGLVTLASRGNAWYASTLVWAVFTVEEVVYNADVNEYIRAAGP
jgi:hypothetical protein